MAKQISNVKKKVLTRIFGMAVRGSSGVLRRKILAFGQDVPKVKLFWIYQTSIFKGISLPCSSILLVGKSPDVAEDFG